MFSTFQSSPSLIIQTPIDKRNCSINELIETERKYVEDIDLIISKFMIPMNNVLKKEEKDSIFFSIEVYLVLFSLKIEVISK